MAIAQHYFTWCPQGIGLEDVSGYQTRARSPSVSPSHEKIIRRYGGRYELPRSLSPLKNRAEDLTAEELAACPVAIHFYPVDQGLVGLTRVCLCPRQRSRGGNFFSHTLLLSWDALKPVGYNPIEASRSALFRATAEDADPKLLDEPPTMPPISSLSEYNRRTQEACHRVNGDLLCQLLACALASSEGRPRRPIILCPSSPQDGERLIEAVLLLLPSSYRGLVRFSTYEVDPYRVMERGEQASSPQLLIVSTVSRGEGGQFQFRDDEYNSGYYIFNLQEGRQSPAPEPSAYVRYMCAAVARHDWESVQGLQRVIDLLGDADPSSWDSLISAAALLSPAADNQADWNAVIEAVMRAAAQSHRAAQALELLWTSGCLHQPHMSAEVTGKWLCACGHLAEVAAPQARELFRTWADGIARVLAGLVHDGRYAMALECMALCENGGSELRAQVVSRTFLGLVGQKHVALPPPSQATQEEVGAFAEVLEECLRTAVSAKDPTSNAALLLMAGLDAAASGSCLHEVWERVGHWLMQEGLESLPPQQQAEWVRVAHEKLASDEHSQSRRDLRLWQMTHLGPGQENQDLFQQLADDCRLSRTPAEAAQQLLDKAREAFKGRVPLPLLAALFSHGPKVARPEAGREYVAAMQALEEASAWQTRRQMVKQAGGVEMLAWEFLGSLFPWSAGSGRRGIQDWCQEILARTPDLARAVAAGFCEATRLAGDRQSALDALHIGLQEFTRTRCDPQAVNILVQGLALNARFDEYDHPSVSRYLAKAETTGWSREAKAARVVGCALQASRGQDPMGRPNLDLLVRHIPFLGELMSLLDDAHWDEAAEWIASGIDDENVEDAPSIRALIRLLLAPEPSSPAQHLGVGPAQPPGAERLDLAAGHIKRRLSQVLLHGPYRDDLCTHACSLSLFIVEMRTVQLQERTLTSPSLLQQGAANIVGSVLGKDARQTRMLLWRRLEARRDSLFDDQGEWLAGFAREVDSQERLSRRPVGIVRRVFGAVCGRREKPAAAPGDAAERDLPGPVGGLDVATGETRSRDSAITRATAHNRREDGHAGDEGSRV